jgi:hypothetical protein
MAAKVMPRMVMLPRTTPGVLKNWVPRWYPYTRHLKNTRAGKSGWNLHDFDGSDDDAGVWIQGRE